MVVLIFLLVVVLALWSYESYLHRRALRAIPIRVHVNGSRGKSSVTRLIGAALNEGGIRTVAKVTGTKARLILPDGSEEPVIRLSTPNICEQITILNRARKEGAQAMVMECMAVRPDLQKVAEHHIMHSTIGVITNVRPDHLDVMGPTVDDVATALSSTVPKNSLSVLGDSRYAGLMGRVARGRGTVLRVAKPEEIASSVMSGFRYLEHEENVATVLEVTRALGVPDDVAIRGMYKANPDVGVCSCWKFELEGIPFEFHNIFAANDLESTITVWHKLGLEPGSGSKGSTSVALLNMRADRIDRSLQFAESVEKGLRADHYILIGGITASVLRQFEMQVPRGRLWPMHDASVYEVFEQISRFGKGIARVGGVGNIGGIGHEVLEFVASGGHPPDEAVRGTGGVAKAGAVIGAPARGEA